MYVSCEPCMMCMGAILFAWAIIAIVAIIKIEMKEKM